MFFKNIFFNSNDYTITDKKIKNGTFGTVHIINNKFDHLEYCAKFLHIEENADQNEETILIQEFYTQSTLIHPSIVKILGINFRSIIDLTRYQPIILTKYYKNGSLRDIFEKRKRNIIDEKWTITKRYIFILGVVDAMKYIHDHDILHIDLKPENILIDENYFPKVCDFGLSICFPKLYYQSMKSNLSNSFYLPPEMILDNGYGKGVDVYAFSMIAYELLTDKEPYFDLQNNNNPSLEDLWNRICQGTRPKFTENVPEKMIKLISQCWNQNPEERPSFSEIFQQLTSDLSFYPDEIDREEIHEYISKVLNQPNVQIFDKDYQKRDEVIELLFKACESGDVKLAKEILSNPNFDVNKTLTFISQEEVKETTEKNALHVAVEKQKYEIVKLLLSRPEIDVNARYNYLKKDYTSSFDGSEEKTALHIAIKKKNLEITKLLLNHPGIDVNAQFRFIKKSKDKVSEKTALHLAIEENNLPILKILLDHNEINVNAIYKSVSTEYVSKHSSKIGNEKEVLLEKTALHMINNNNNKMFDLLLTRQDLDTNILYREIHKYDCSEPKEKFDPIDTIEKTALYLAVYENNIHIVQKILNHSTTKPNICYKECTFDFDKYNGWNMSSSKGKNYEGKDEYYNIIEYAPLHLAAEKNYLEIVHLLLASPELDINIVSKTKRTTFLHKTEKKEETALLIALSNQNFEIAKLLLTRPGINANFLCKRKNGHTICEETAIHIASIYGNVEIVRLLLEIPQIEINALYKSWLDSPDRYHEYDTYEKTALHIATENEDTVIIQLLTKKSDIIANIPSKHLSYYKDGNYSQKTNDIGKTALHIAIEKENTEIVQYLLSLDNIDVNAIFEYTIDSLEKSKNNETPLILAINKKNIEIVKLLLNKPEININQIFIYKITENLIYEMTVLQLAVEKNFNELALLLIANPKVDVNTITKINSTPQSEFFKNFERKYSPLYIAVKNENVEIVKALLSRSDINVNIKLVHQFEEHNSSKVKEKTVLHTAAKKGNLEIIQLLLNRPDLDVAISKKDKGTAMKTAIKKGNIKVIELLLERMKDIIDSKDKKDIMKLLEKNGKNEKIMHLIS